ncbi:hypothetical protein N1851_021749 [Merluccius polli]|uniref:Peptidase aspartic putative domain-containing protein n=1 Tax=Merluccius polli TaxID=89951 RepID=A0AA47MJI3_MERPO|nr:hypothetical protein N1851_021749 [Merluccius polli]
MYTRWKYHINGLKRSIKHKEDPEFISEVVTAVETRQVDVNDIYDQIRAIAVPDHEIRRKNDSCYAITKTAKEKARCLITAAGDPEDIPWPETSSVFDCTASTISSLQPTSISKFSDQASLKSAQEKQQAAAEVAATQEVLKIMKSQHECEEEIRELEAEEKKVAVEQEVYERAMEAEKARQKARFVAESSARKRRLEERRKEVERLEELKRHNAAQARLRVYSGVELEDHPALASVDEQGSCVISFVPLQGRVPSIRSSLPHPQGLSHSAAVPQPDILATAPGATNDLVKMLAEAITANRIPIPEPAIFFGDPLQYTDWRMSFHTLIGRKNLPAQEKLFFLRKYVGGLAKRAIDGYSILGTEDAYRAAWGILDDRFGNPFIVGKAYRDKIQSWHKIPSKDSKELQEFVDFLVSVETAMPYVQGLQTLNDCVENQRVVIKLPDWLSSRWNRTATVYQDERKAFPDFKYFVNFLSKEARIACNPITSLQALRSAIIQSAAPLEVFVRNVTNVIQPVCIKIGRETQDPELTKRSPKGAKGLQEEGLSNPTGVWRRSKPYPIESSRKGKTLTRRQSCRCMSTTANPEEEILVYALLDTQSDTTFILKDIADQLHVKQDLVRLKISTVTSIAKVASSHKLYGLQVRGLMADERIKLPVTYTREYIPANKSDIPTCKTAKGWPHLEHLADEMPPELDCEVGLLIGYNCPQVLLPRNVVSGKEGQPFAQKSILGWSIIGYSNFDGDFEDEIGVSHRIISREVYPTTQPPLGFKSEVHFVRRTTVKEILTPEDMIKIFESDFTERTGEDIAI